MGFAVGLVGNLATGTVQVEASWWAPATWAATVVLIVAAVLLVVLQVHRAAEVTPETREGDDDPNGRAFTSVRRVYAGRLRDRYRRVDLEILLPSDQSEHPAMLLGEVFVPQLVRDDPPPRELLELPREVLLRLVDSGELIELPQEVDRAQLEQAQRDYQGRPARPVLEAVAAASSGIVVLGDPGAGKSTLARYLMLALAAGELDEVTTVEVPGNLTGRLPLIVELRQFADQRWRDAEFLDFLDDQYRREGFGLPRPMLEKFLGAGGRALVVFDGLDEIFDPKQRNAVARQIDWFARSHPTTRVMVTSRVIGYDRAVFDRAGFTTLMLQDLTRQQITQFTTAWFERSCAGQPADATRLCNRILGVVADSTAVAELAGNPMLLTILAIIARRRELPRDRRSVYEHAVMLLIDQWDVNKELAGQHTDLPRLQVRDKLRMLHDVARRMQDGPAGLAGNHLPGDDLATLFQDYFTGRLGLPADRAVQAARAMLQQLRDRNFILASYGADLYGFVHRAFLEFLAADAINQRFTDRRLTEHQLLAVYDERWSDPAWTEVLLLLAGMVPEQFAAGAAVRLLSADPAWRARNKIPRHLLLALRIAAEIDHSPELSPHARALTLAVIALLAATEQHEKRSVVSWRQAINQALSPLLTYSPGRRWFDVDRYQRWYRSGVHSPLGQFAARCYLTTQAQSFAHLQHTALHDEASALRQVALQVVGAGWPAYARTLGLLRDRTIHDEHPDVRYSAIQTVGAGWAGDAQALGLLSDRAIHDEHPDVRQAAVQAVGAGWAGDAQALGLLRDRAIHDEHPDVRQAAVQAVGAGWAGDPEAFTWLRDCATHDRHEIMRHSAVRAVGAGWAGDAQALDLLCDLAIHDEHEIVRNFAILVVGTGWIGDARALGLLRDRAIHDEHSDVRYSAVQAVGAGWADDPEVRTWLRDLAFYEEHVQVRYCAVLAMGEGWTGDAQALIWFRDRATGDQNEAVRRFAATALGAKWAGDAQALDPLRDLAIHDVHSDVRRSAVQALGAGWAGVPEVLDLLRDRATYDEHPDVRLFAIQGLGRKWAGDALALDVLRDRATHDVHPEVRLSAVRALREGWAEDPEILDVLRDCATYDERESVRQAAIRALMERWAGDAQALDVLRNLATHNDHSDVRQAAIRALGTGWAGEPELLDVLRDLATHDDHSEVQRLAEALIGYLA